MAFLQSVGLISLHYLHLHLRLQSIPTPTEVLLCCRLYFLRNLILLSLKEKVIFCTYILLQAICNFVSFD